MDKQKKGTIRGFEEVAKTAGPGKSKYGNKKVTVDGIVFDSKKEAARYLELRMLVKIGEITELRLQAQYELNTGGTHSVRYIADFVYKSQGIEVVEDCKGYKTKVYLKKKRLMLKIHGVKIKES